MTDLGKRVKVTKELIDSNVVKAGVLINGEIAYKR
jgi:hypothetical protein